MILRPYHNPENIDESLGALFTWNTTPTAPASDLTTMKMKGIDWLMRTEPFTP